MPQPRRIRSPFFPILSLGIAAAHVLLSNGSAFAQTVDENLWVTNGVVGTVACDGGTIYIGGAFSYVGPHTGGGVVLDAVSGALPLSFPKVAGSVDAVVSDGAGGWYLGGVFTAVGGAPRSNLAHLDPDLSVSAWNPNANGAVRALAMTGSTVYAGGDFTSIGGQTRNHVAAIDAVTGVATAWNPGANPVRALALGGSTIYVGGVSYLAAFDLTSGVITAWNPGGVDTYSLAVSGSIVYVGGVFNFIGGKARNYIAAVDATTGAATPWNPNADGVPRTIAVSDEIVYVGGTFTNIGGASRSRVAALNNTGAATGWDPNANNEFLVSDVFALAVSGSTVYAGGDFTSIGGEARNDVAALNTTNGVATAWNPAAAGVVHAVAVNGSDIFVGGLFNSIGGRTRNYAAALDAATGAATAWNPNPDGPVENLVVSGSTIYATGGFTTIGGQPRNTIAALDKTTGAAGSWNPDTDGGVAALAVSGSIVYVGGAFTLIGGQMRNNLAALDATTAAATPWDPDADNTVFDLVVAGSTVYANGDFANIGGQARHRLAALDVTSGIANDWNPNPVGQIYAMAATGSEVYVGGEFSTIGGQARSNIAALDLFTGSATDWDPNAYAIGSASYVFALTVDGSTLYAGGGFSNIGGQPRNNLAALDAVSGAAHPAWNPNSNGIVDALAVNGPTVYAGGGFSTMGGLPQSNIAAMEDLTTPTQLSLGSAHATPDGVDLLWFAPAGEVAIATVYRRTASDDWSALGQVRADGTGRLVFRDARVIAGTRYGYRLGVMGAGQEEFDGETWVDVPVGTRLSLAGFLSNPSASDRAVRFSLPNGSPASLELFDVSGRRIASREVGALGAGSHVVTLGSERMTTPGVYLLRLSQGGHTLTARGTILR